MAHLESTGKCDIVAHFYRRAFTLIRDGGTIGLIATNTIAQGDTRSSGLRWICEHGGDIYRALKRVKWPGDAAVIVSVLHISKGESVGVKMIDGVNVEKITAFLFHQGGNADPIRLEANSGKSFVGAVINGTGFTFDDTDKKGTATPVSEMHRLIQDNPRNQEVIFPYIGGEEFNTSPQQKHHRFVINFGEYPCFRDVSLPSWADLKPDQRQACARRGAVPTDYPGQVASDWPDLLSIVEEKVKPSRLASAKQSKSSHGRRAAIWWKIYHQAKELYAATAGLERVLAIARVGQYGSFAFLPAGNVYSEQLVVFPFAAFGAFCALQSRPHETWVRFFGSSMKDDPRYTPSDCFETFPFPVGWEGDPVLEAAGKAYYEYRAAFMVANDQGMTKTYNRFHDIYETDRRIVELRELHAAMDRAVLDAYGWSDIPTDCEFLLDYDIDETTWGRKKKPYRYRWPDTVRDEVLARLLALNAERAAVEARAGVTCPVGTPLSKPPSDSGSTRINATAVAESPSIYETSNA